MKHNTHYATLRLDRENSKYPLFVIGYLYPNGRIRGYLCANRRISPVVSRAKVFYDLGEARNFVSFDFRDGLCHIFQYAWNRAALCNEPVVMYSFDRSLAL